MFDLQVIRDVQRFERIREFNLMMQMRDAAHSPIKTAIFRVVRGGAEIARQYVPVWTGTLRAHHRVSVTGEGSFVTGRIFIQRGTHPITGTATTEYGPKVHRRKPWLRQTFESQAFEELARSATQMIFNWLQRNAP